MPLNQLLVVEIILKIKKQGDSVNTDIDSATYFPLCGSWFPIYEVLKTYSVNTNHYEGIRDKCAKNMLYKMPRNLTPCPEVRQESYIKRG